MAPTSQGLDLAALLPGRNARWSCNRKDYWCNRYTPCLEQDHQALVIGEPYYRSLADGPANLIARIREAAALKLDLRALLRRNETRHVGHTARRQGGQLLNGLPPENTVPELQVALRITGPVKDGFWVRAIVVIVQSMWASRMGLPVSVSYTPTADVYSDSSSGVQDGWARYFMPIEHTQPGALLLQLDCRAAARLWETEGNYATNFPTAMRQRQLRSSHVRSLGLRPRPNYERKAEQFWSSRFPPNATVLGVHLRGSDKWTGIVPATTYMPLVHDFLCSHAGAAVFVATDDVRMLESFREALPARTLLVWTNSSRSSSKQNPALHAPHSQLNGSGAALGGEVLLDTLLLSRCTFLLKSTSAVSEFAIYFNPQLIHQSYDFNLGPSRLRKSKALQQPYPWWHRACRKAIENSTITVQ